MTIQDIKTSLSIAEVLTNYNLIPDKNNRLCCPWHNDKTPSLQIYPDTNTWTCFSTNCDAGSGDVIDFVMRYEKSSKHEAILKAAEMTGVRKISLDKIAILTKFYQESLKYMSRSKKAQEYVQSRSLAIDGIGYAPYDIAKNWKTDFKNSVKSIGLHNIKNCLIFPLKNEAGQIVSIYGRSISDKNTAKHFYLKGGYNGLFPKYPPTKTKILILTECIIDAASLLQNTHFEVLALFGTNGFTKEHRKAVSHNESLEEVIFFFDGDGAGDAATIKYTDEIKAIHPNIKISAVKTPRDTDVNSLLQNQGLEVLKILIEERKPLIKNKTIEFDLPSMSQNTLNTNNPNNIHFTTPTANYYIKGGIRKDLDSLKITLVIEHLSTKQKSRNKLDLYEDKQTEKVSREAGEKLDLRNDLIEKDLNQLTDLLDEYREQETAKNNENKKVRTTLSAIEKSTYINFGKQKDLMLKINELIGKAGIVGEENNRLFLFCGAVSHQMKKPLNIVVQGGSGSGKSFLIKVISYLVPQEKVKRYTRLSEKSFYNFGEFDLCNTLIIIEDYDGMNEEVEYAFREIQSNGELISAVSGKEFENAEIQTKDKIVRGPIASMVATTKGDLYHDNSTRVFFIAIDESETQTQAIIDYKNKRANAEILPSDEEKAKQFLRGFVKTLKSYKVINPYLKYIKLPVSHDQLRRLHELMTAFANQITLLHQHQRKKTSEGHLIAQKEDMKMAIELMFDSILLKVDELDGSLRKFYENLKDYVKKRGRDFAFIQRDVRLDMRISKTQMHRCINALLDLEYISKSSIGRRNTFHYKICYWDNMTATRERIKKELNEQLASL